jgi:hypothetical protein
VIRDEKWLIDSRQLSRELGALHDRLKKLAARISAARLQVERVAAFRQAERVPPDRLDELERVLDPVRIADHVRAAVRRSEITEAPVPHAIVAGVLPPDVFAAAIDAIPARVFFELRGDRQQVEVPPVLAPTAAIVTWTFLAEIAKRVFMPALIDRFSDRLKPAEAGVGLTVSRHRIVLQQPGPTIGDDQPNSALMLFHSLPAHHRFVLLMASKDTERYTWEFRIGPDRIPGR